MRLTTLDPDEHDRLLAEVSHLPHAVAAALVAMQDDKGLGLCGKGFLDTTRVAGRRPPMAGHPASTTPTTSTRPCTAETTARPPRGECSSKKDGRWPGRVARKGVRRREDLFQRKLQEMEE